MVSALIGLVSCSAQKLTRPAPARELYCSSLFRKSLAYAQDCCGSVYILSAKYGLVTLDRILEPYDQRLDALPHDARRAWGRDVIVGLTQWHPVGDVLALAGHLYVEAIPWAKLLNEGRTLYLPLHGMQIGERLRWLSQQRREA